MAFDFENRTGPYDSRGPNPFLELDEINTRYGDLAHEYREAGETERFEGVAAIDRERKRIKSLMEWEMEVYAAKLGMIERAVNEYRLRIRREDVRRLEAGKRGKLDRALSDAQNALGGTVVVHEGRKAYGGLYDLGNSVFDLIERLRRALQQ